MSIPGYHTGIPNNGVGVKKPKSLFCDLQKTLSKEGKENYDKIRWDHQPVNVPLRYNAAQTS